MALGVEHGDALIRVCNQISAHMAQLVGFEGALGQLLLPLNLLLTRVEQGEEPVAGHSVRLAVSEKNQVTYLSKCLHVPLILALVGLVDGLGAL